MKIHIAAPDIHVGDAVGNHCLALALDFEEKGAQCELFSERSTSPSQHVSPIQELIYDQDKHTNNDLLIVGYSIYDPNLTKLLSLPGKKLVYFHGITPPELLLEHDPASAYFCARGYAQLPLLDQFDHIVANSEYNLIELMKHIKMIAATKRVSVIPPISSRFPLFSQKPRIKRPWPTDGKALKLLAIGRVVPHKRIEDLVAVVSLLARKGVEAYLDIVGDCSNAYYRKHLEELADSQGVLGKIHIHGVVDMNSLAQHYRSADLLLVASLHEGFCVPVLEAMHLGLPVMVRKGTAACEVLNIIEHEHDAPNSYAEAIVSATEKSMSRALKLGKMRAQKLLEATNLERWPVECWRTIKRHLNNE